jgi:hypothetical protein
MAASHEHRIQSLGALSRNWSTIFSRRRVGGVISRLQDAPAGCDQEFINGALRDHQRQLIAGDLSKAMRVLSLAFCAPELVPHDMVAELETNILVEMLEEATTFANHL